MNVKIKVTVKVLGVIWMPAVTCATSFTIGDSDNARFTEPFDLTDDAECLEFAEHFAYGEKGGDFQRITDLEIIREVTEIAQAGNVIQTKSTFTTIRPWQSEDNEMAWIDATYGVETV